MRIMVLECNVWRCWGCQVSRQSDHIHELLIRTFPHNIITKEHYIKYLGQKLFFDFYIKDYAILFEIQGKQHSEYVSHFHGDRQGYLEMKSRDNLKLRYCQEKELDLVIINYDEEINTPGELIEKINIVISS